MLNALFAFVLVRGKILFGFLLVTTIGTNIGFSLKGNGVRQTLENLGIFLLLFKNK